jgi:hypothetical protein
MRKGLLVIVTLCLLSGCAPSMPDGLKEAIERVYPNAKYLEARQEGSGLWCVAYQPDPSQELVVVQVFRSTTWIPVNEG